MLGQSPYQKGVATGLDSGHVLCARRRHGRIEFSAVAHTTAADITAAALPSTACVTRVLDTPLSSKNKALRVLPALLDIQLPFALEDCLYGFAPLRRTPTGTTGVACAARKCDIEQALAKRQQQGEDPVHLYPEPLILWAQALRDKVFTAGAHGALLYVSAQHYTLVLGDGLNISAAHGGRLDAEGNLPDTARTQLLRRAGPTPRRWMICGPGQSDLLERLQQACSEQGSAHISPAPELVLAKGLAAAALEDQQAIPDFRSGPFIHPLTQQHRRRSLITAGLLYGLAGLLLAGSSLGTLFIQKVRWQEGRSDLAARASRLIGYAPQPGMEILEAERALDALQAELSAYETVYTPGPISSLEHWLRTAQQARLRLNLISLQTEAVELSGQSPDWAGPESLLAAVQRQQPTARLLREDAGRDEQIHFTILSGGSDE